MKFDLEKRALDLFPEPHLCSSRARPVAIKLAREAYEAGKRETAAAIVSAFEEKGWMQSADLARRYATPPPAAAPTPEAIEEVRAMLRLIANGGPVSIWCSERAREALAKLEGRS